MPCTTTTETLRTTETAQTKHTHATHCLVLSPTTYHLSKFLTILKPLTNESQHNLESTENCTEAIMTVQVPDDYKLVSFDMKPVFTSIPHQLALDCSATTINNSTIKLPLPTDDSMDLLNLCLTSTYFSITASTKNSCREHLWAHQFPLL